MALISYANIMDDSIFTFRIDKVSKSTIKYIGSAFFVNKNGLFLTAKHNFEIGKLNEYRAYIDNEHYEISLEIGIENSYQFQDVVVLKVVFRTTRNISTARIRSLSPQKIVGNHAVVIGYDSDDGRAKKKSLHISDYRNGLFELTDGAIYHGFSGGPLLHNGSVVGVITSRESDQKSYASALSDEILPNIVIEPPQIFDEIKAEIFQIEASVKKFYLEIGNPIVAYRTSSAILQAAGDRVLKNPATYASMQISLGYMLVNSDCDEASLYIAIDHLNCAIDCLQQLEYTEEVVKKIVRANWLIAIAFRLLNRPNDASRTCENIISHRIMRSTDYIVKLPIVREIAIINKDTKLFKDIEQHEQDYSQDQIETFFSYRRLFEHFLNLERFDVANKYLLPTKESFHRVKIHIFKVYEATFLKNQFHLALAKKDMQLAKQLYLESIRQMEKNELYGQRRALEKIAEKFNFNSNILLDLM
jgi:hypothetical protein